MIIARCGKLSVSVIVQLNATPMTIKHNILKHHIPKLRNCVMSCYVQNNGLICIVPYRIARWCNVMLACSIVLCITGVSCCIVVMCVYVNARIGPCNN